HATIERLQRELNASQAALAATRAEVDALKSALAAATGPTVTAFAPSPAGSAASKYADEYPALEVGVSPVSSPSGSLAARMFTPVSESQGFKYVYLPCRAREKYSDVRKKLKSLKIDTARILDVHYPAQKVIALLVHNDY
ncbi:hypothetical protein BD770DRAFT_302658, partial [Pilaira anomala]